MGVTIGYGIELSESRIQRRLDIDPHFRSRKNVLEDYEGRVFEILFSASADDEEKNIEMCRIISEQNWEERVYRIIYETDGSIGVEELLLGKEFSR